MRLRMRDAIATLIVAAIVAPFAWYEIHGGAPFVHDPRGMAGVGLVGLFLAVVAFGGRKAFTRDAYLLIAAAVAGLGLGIAALVAETNEMLLAAFIGSIVVYWLLGVLVDTGAVGEGAGPRSRPAHA